MGRDYSYILLSFAFKFLAMCVNVQKSNYLNYKRGPTNPLSCECFSDVFGLRRKTGLTMKCPNNLGERMEKPQSPEPGRRTPGEEPEQPT